MLSIAKKSFLFAGQGSQYPAMGKELEGLFPKAAQSIFETGSQILGFDLKDVCYNFEPQALAQTQYSQPAIFAVSLIAFEAAKAKGFTPDMVGGHSLGEYAAMVACGILTLEAGFAVIKARAKAMGECAQNQNGAMCAIIGSDAEAISKVCEETAGYVVPVNYNSPAQTVIAGDAEAVAAAAEKFAQMGKRTSMLAVSAAFHSKLMQPAADEFKKAIAGVAFNSPGIPFYSNLSGDLMTDFSDMPGYGASHIVSPVRFCDELAAMQRDGAEAFIECGPGKVLSGLVKRTLSDVEIYNIEDERSAGKLQ